MTFYFLKFAAKLFIPTTEQKVLFPMKFEYKRKP